jgi:hypothetical protein
LLAAPSLPKLQLRSEGERIDLTDEQLMTAIEFRTMALALPEAVESAHMDHPDFRVGGRIFATLGYPAEGWGVVLLSPEDQKQFCAADRETFVPVKGAWGRAGNTQVNLKAATKTIVRDALRAAWQERVRKNAKKSHKGNKSH